MRLSHLPKAILKVLTLTSFNSHRRSVHPRKRKELNSEMKTGDQIYEELTKEVLDKILDQDSDEDEAAIAEILDDQLKSLHPAPETQGPSEETGDSATAPQTDNPNGQGESPGDDQTEFFRNFNPDAYRI
jgi:hypothetical protein